MYWSKQLLLAFSFLLLAIAPANGQQEREAPFLSNLNITADDPLYTTYAAHMERSEFTLDEGYHFTFYKPEEPLAFTTDTAGDLFLIFVKDGQRVYRPVEMRRKPVITASYTDMVTYHYYPFEGIRVDAAFQTYSSKQALLDVKVTNQANEPADLEVYAVLKNDYRTFNQVDFRPDDRSVTFHHEELPDGWVTGHDVPYVADVQDVLLFSDQPESMNSYHIFGREKFSMPHRVQMDKPAEKLVWGELQHEDGERCRHTPPQSGLIAYLDSDRTRLLTEKAPRWGSSDRNITGYGFFGVELGALESKDGSNFTIRYWCGQTGQSARLDGNFSDFRDDSSIRRDLELKKAADAPAPANLGVKKVQDGSKVELSWNKSGHSANTVYYVYKRSYPADSYYQKIAEVEGQTTFSDTTNPNQIHGYIITAVVGDGEMSMPSNEALTVPPSSFVSDLDNNGPQKNRVDNLAKAITVKKNISLEAGDSHSMRVVRAVSRPNRPDDRLIDDARRMLSVDLEAQLAYNESLYGDIPRLDFNDRETNLLYWSSYNLMRQVMLPPEGQLNHNYYVFSREPTWGWGHGGQVFHESLTMLAYGYMDPESAMESQRVYEQVQYDNGYINYRTGSFLNEQIPVDGQNTTSAPWYAWQNWELYKITGDKQFLDDMYASSKKFYNYYTSTRDSDGDGLLEWGGHAVLESVRDASVAVWDEVAWPTNFEAMDLNTMIVSEEKALANMAEELGKTDEANEFREAAQKRTELINQTMWDEETGFYYQVDKKDNDFSYDEKNDLKRKEIIGFLPLWAGVASDEQAKRLVEEHLTNPDEFWRPYGVPSLSASDSYYNPKGYWNGPVWVEWNYLIEDGLLKYGFKKEARELVDRVAANMIDRLKKDHNLWEFYSPDDSWGGYHKTYIWAGIINRMLVDVYADPGALSNRN